MANVANTKNTGPASKDAISGGKKFPIKEHIGKVSHSQKKLSNTSTDAKSTIKGMRIKSTGFGGRPNKQTFTSTKAK